MRNWLARKLFILAAALGAVSLSSSAGGRRAPTDAGRLVGYGSFMDWPALVTAMRAELAK